MPHPHLYLKSAAESSQARRSSLQASVSGNESRNNTTGMYVGDFDATARTQVLNNNLHDNGTGLQFDDNVEAYNNTARLNTGIGIQLTNNGPNTLVRDNYSIKNAVGIQVGTGRVFHNRVVGNSGAGILLNFNAVNANANSVYGNSVGIEVSGFLSGFVLTDNIVYDNANQGIYIHNAATSCTGGS